MTTIERLPAREPAMRIPTPVDGEPGLVTVDGTWGEIQPLHLPGGVETLAELDVIAHIEAGGTLVDTRQPDQAATGTLPGALTIRHQDVVEALDGVDADPIVLFCNGPQCKATPQAVTALLEAGWDPRRLRYYRGGIHDWVTLGLPLVTPG